MPATPISGVEGNFTIAGHNFRCKDWTLMVAQDLHDTTGFGETWRSNVKGLKGFRGTASGILLSDGTNTSSGVTLGTSLYSGVAFTLTATASSRGTVSYTGNAHVTSYSTGQTIEGIAGVSIGFVGEGALTVNEDLT
jgi:hypothetical protein